VSAFANLSHLAGWAGCLILIISSLITAAGYRGKRGERYSALNHFISELGERGVSRLAPVFNIGLIAGGMLLLPYLISLGLLMGNLWAKLGMAAGIWTAGSCALVGLFPMDNREMHTRVAMSFFRGGLVTLILFSLAVWRQPVAHVAKTVNIAGAMGICAYAAFLIIASRQLKEEELQEPDPEDSPERPRFWILPAVEWTVFLTTIIWFFCLGLGMR